MKETKGTFEYRVIHRGKKGEKVPPIIRIGLDSRCKDGDDWPYFTPDLMTREEARAQIKLGKQDLDRIGVLVEREFDQADRKNRTKGCEDVDGGEAT